MSFSSSADVSHVPTGSVGEDVDDDDVPGMALNFIVDFIGFILTHLINSNYFDWLFDGQTLANSYMYNVSD